MDQTESVTLITCTGGRPQAFAFLEGWIARQTYKGQLDWIVVDDCDPATLVTMGQRVIRPFPRWRPGQITLGRNMSVALSAVQSEKIMVIEDDEIYLPDYVLTMARLLDRAPLVGEIPARYYNVRRRCFLNVDNRRHASLCQTGIRSSLIDRLQTLCVSPSPFIDMRLWQAPGVLEAAANVVSIKGLPGRQGIGIGHRPTVGWTPDPVLAQLRAWIGPFADLYAPFFEAPAC